MLTITIYKNVPFNSNYDNVLLLASISALDNYLSTYQVGVISNVSMFYANENKINLTQFYEDCNYMKIHDTASTRADKYYFIDNVILKSASCFEYSITCDIWATYALNINFKKSLCVGGHIYEFGNLNHLFKFTSPVLPSVSTDTTNLIIKPIGSETYVSMICIIKYTDAHIANAKTQCGILFKYDLKENIQLFLQTIEGGAIWRYDENDSEYKQTFEAIKCLIIPSFNFGEYFSGFLDAIEVCSVQQSILGRIEIDLINGMYYIEEEDEETETTTRYQKWLPYFKKMTIGNKNVFNTSTSDTFERRRKSKVLCGILGNTQEIEIPLHQNPQMRLYLNLLGCEQLDIFFEISNFKLNLTSSFEIPLYIDDYQNYMNRNQNQIDVSNKSNALNTALSIAGAGAMLSVAGGKGLAGAIIGTAIGAGNNTRNLIGGIIQENAKFEDLKNTFSRFDTTNANCSQMLQNGCGAYTLYYADNQIENKFKLFGEDCNNYISQYKPNDTSLYNFIYIHFNNTDLTGPFNNTIKKALCDIFNKGVRIWFDKNTFLTDVNYLK